MMAIGSLQVELLIPGCSSLKEKRIVLKSLKTRLCNKLNVSVAEIDYLDKWQRALIGLVCVSNQRKHAEEILEKAVCMVEREDRVQILDQLTEIL